jgi:uncharacterized RDD family membrane protein YckC
LTLERLDALRDRPLASFGARFAAFAIDMGLVVVICTGIELLLHLREFYRPVGERKIHLEVNPFHSWGIVVLALYFGVGTFLGHGQTLGKRLLRIRVVSLTHGHLSLWHALERAVGYGASVLEGGFGFLQYFIHPNRQTVHDRIAETIVVKDPKRPKKGDSRPDEPRDSEAPDQDRPAGP